MASGLGHAAHDGPSGSDGTMTTFIRALHPQVRPVLLALCRKLLSERIVRLSLAHQLVRGLHEHVQLQQLEIVYQLLSLSGVQPIPAQGTFVLNAEESALAAAHTLVVELDAVMYEDLSATAAAQTCAMLSEDHAASAISPTRDAANTCAMLSEHRGSIGDLGGSCQILRPCAAPEPGSSSPTRDAAQTCAMLAEGGGLAAAAHRSPAAAALLGDGLADTSHPTPFSSGPSSLLSSGASAPARYSPPSKATSSFASPRMDPIGNAWDPTGGFATGGVLAAAAARISQVDGMATSGMGHSLLRWVSNEPRVTPAHERQMLHKMEMRMAGGGESGVEADARRAEQGGRGWRPSSEPYGDLSDPAAARAPRRRELKERFVWSDELHRRFVAAVTKLGLREAKPQTILALMRVRGDEAPNRHHIKSHLQKYRLHVEQKANAPSCKAGRMLSRSDSREGDGLLGGDEGSSVDVCAGSDDDGEDESRSLHDVRSRAHATPRVAHAC